MVQLEQHVIYRLKAVGGGGGGGGGRDYDDHDENHWGAGKFQTSMHVPAVLPELSLLAYTET